MTDEELIEAAAILKQEEDDELEALFTEMEMLFISVVLAYVFEFEDAMEVLLIADLASVQDISNKLVTKYPKKAPKDKTILRQLGKRDFVNAMQNDVIPIAKKAYHMFYEEFNKEYNNAGASFNYRSAKYKEIEEWLDDLPNKMQLTTNNRVVELIRKSYEEGKGVDWLADKLADSSAFSHYRARTTAITENRRMYHAAQYQSFLDNEYIISKEWKHTHGVKEPRPMHVKADGQTVAKFYPFVINGIECDYPLDPKLPAEETIHCHCYMIPGIIGE